VKVKKEVREQIRQQRSSKCDECGEPGTRFCFQRKKNVRKHPELANDADNVWMRCESCHRRWEEERAANRRPGDLRLREQSAGVGSKTVEHSVSEATPNTSSTADRNSEARVFWGELLYAPPQLHEKCSGAQRPKAGGGDDDRAKGLLTPRDMPAERVNTYQSAAALNLKLRQQAKELGLTPGSPRWRAYVLGTVTAAAKEKKKKEQSKCL
jgi:hypothetical protein